MVVFKVRLCVCAILCMHIVCVCVCVRVYYVWRNWTGQNSISNILYTHMSEVLPKIFHNFNKLCMYFCKIDIMYSLVYF
jgi:hypothetical protein